MKTQKMMIFFGLFFAGFGIGWFFFRHRDTKIKIIAGIIGAISVPIILYVTLGQFSGLSDSAPPPISIQNFFAAYGFGNYASGESPKSPTSLK